jgi:hypothetical protein
MAAPVLQFKRGNAGVGGTIPALRPGEPGFSLNNFDLFVGFDTSVSGNKFFGSHRYWLREDGTTSLRFKLVDKDGSNYVALKTPDTLAGIVTYVLPGTQGGSQTVLTNDGSGNLSWSSGSLNAVFSGITTIGGDYLDVNTNADFSGITTFSNTTDNTLGDANTGAVQIDGGLGVNKNVTVGGNLNVQGYAEFVGVATFKGGTINLGDSNTDDINVAGEFISNLVPNTDATYDIGDNGTPKRWRHAAFSGVGTFATGLVADNVRLGIGGAGVVDTTSGSLYLDSAAGTTVINDHVDIIGDLDVTGNISLGGTTVTLRGADVFIENKDIVLGYTTSITPNDTTANHAGVAIASTVGTPLADFNASGINTLPNTYKQLMWFQSGTLGFSTDAFAFNYGVAIGTTTMANGVRLAVGTGVTVGDTSVSASTFYGSLVGNVSSANQVKTVTASNNNANYYVTFVDANNGSATNETVYTDDGIYYNPGTNKLTTQHAEFTGNVLVSGISTLAGNVFLGDSGSDLITVVGVTTFTTSNVYIDNQLFVGGLQVTGGASIGVDVTTRHISATGIATVSGLIDGNGGADISGGETTLSSATVSDLTAGRVVLAGTSGSLEDSANLTFGAGGLTVGAGGINVTGVSTFASNVITNSDLTVGGNLYVNGSTTQVNTASITVEDRTIELGVVNGSAPGSATTWDLGVIFNYNSSGAKKSGVVWEHADGRFKFGSEVTAGDGTDNNTPQITFTTYAPIEISALWVNDCAGQSQVISCTGTERFLQNITIDAGTF